MQLLVICYKSSIKLIQRKKRGREEDRNKRMRRRGERKKSSKLDMVAHIYNPSYSEGLGKRITNSRPASVA